MRKTPSPDHPVHLKTYGVSATILPPTQDHHGCILVNVTRWDVENGTAEKSIISYTLPMPQLGEPQLTESSMDTWTLTALRSVVRAAEDRFEQKVRRGEYQEPSRPRLGLVHD